MATFGIAEQGLSDLGSLENNQSEESGDSSSDDIPLTWGATEDPHDSEFEEGGGRENYWEHISEGLQGINDEASSEEDLEEVEPVAHPLQIGASGFSDSNEPSMSERGLLMGATFITWADFDLALHEYEACTGWCIKRLSRNTLRFHGRCRGWEAGNDRSCRVELAARLMKKTGLITIRTSFLVHTCKTSLHIWRNGANRSQWVSRKVHVHVKVNHDCSVKQLRDTLINIQGVDSKPWTIQRARAECRQALRGGGKDSFTRIPAYAKRLLEADPHSHVFWETTSEKRFLRLYIAPASSQHAFNYCRPFVGLDGTHIVGEFPMTALISTCFDGENHICILAWAIVSRENGENWSWFLQHLRVSYPKMRQGDMVFVSDRDKGLIASVKDVFGDAWHSHCSQHIKGNIQGISDVQCGSFFIKVVKAKTEHEWEQLLQDFEPMNQRQGGVVDYIRGLDPELYARWAFPSPHWGHTTSNVVEVINGAIKPMHKMPALLLSGQLWDYEMVHHFKRAQLAKAAVQGNKSMIDYAQSMFNKLWGESRGMKLQQSSETQGLLHDNRGSWALRMEDKYCECGDWKEMDFPCTHVMYFETQQGNDPEEHVGQIWKAVNQMETYRVPMPPISIDRLASSDQCIEPICIPRKKKTKVIKRKQSTWEAQLGEQQRSQKKQTQRCGNCKMEVHNKRGCLMPTPTLANRNGSQEMLRVMAVHSMSRATMEEAWRFYNTQPMTISFSDWFAQTHPLPTHGTPGSGPSQVTQE